MADEEVKDLDNIQPINYAGPAKGDFIPPPEAVEAEEPEDALPEQEEFWRPPVRFGSVPVEKEPLGWDRRRGFRKLFPVVMLPTQVVERVSFGHPEERSVHEMVDIMKDIAERSILYCLSKYREDHFRIAE